MLDMLLPPRRRALTLETVNVAERKRTMYRSGPSLFGIVYFIIGIIIATTHGYLSNLSSLSNILSALLAILLWPALLFGANLHITLGTS